MDLSEFLLAWRTTPLPDREVIDALVHPGHAGPSTALAAAHAGVGPPPAARRRDLGADRRTRRGHPGAVAGTATQSRPPGPRTGRGNARRHGDGHGRRR